MNILVPVAAVAWYTVTALLSRRHQGAARAAWGVVALAPVAVLIWAQLRNWPSQGVLSVSLAAVAAVAAVLPWLPLGGHQDSDRDPR